MPSDSGGANGASAILYYLFAYTFTTVGTFGVLALCERLGEDAVEGLAVAAAAVGWSTLDHDATTTTGEESVAVQLIDAQSPGTDVILASMAGIR